MKKKINKKKLKKQTRRTMKKYLFDKCYKVPPALATMEGLIRE